MPAPPNPTQPKKVAYAYLIRWEWRSPRGLATQTSYGCRDLPPGSSRYQVLVDLIREKTEELGVEPTPVSFTIEPDTL